MKRMLLMALVAVGVGFAASAAKADTDVKVLSGPCDTCHGTAGKLHSAIPSIAGRPAEILAKSLRDFKSGTTTATVMNRIAKGLSDEEIDRLAKHFSLNK